MKFFLHLFLFYIVFIHNTMGITVTSVSSGNWSAPSTWNCNCVPVPEDDFTIKAGHVIALTANTEARSINIDAANAAINIGSFILDVKRTSINRGIITGSGNLLFGSGSSRTFTNTGTISVSNIEVVLNSIFENSATITVSGNIILTAGSWTNAAFSTINIAGTIVGPAGNFTGSAGGNSVNYNRNGDQNVLGTTYHHLTVSGSGTKTLTGPVIASGRITISGSAQLDVSTLNYPVALAGDWTNSSSHPNAFVERSGNVLFNNSTGDPQNIIKDTEETFYSLTIDNSSKDVFIENDIAVNGTLTLSTGDLVLSNRMLTLGASSSISGGSAASYIQNHGTSQLKKVYAAGFGDDVVRTFPMGDNDEYNPLTLELNPLTIVGSGGYVSMQITDGTHPSLAAFPGASYLSKYWTLTSGNITLPNFNISYVYSDTDVVGTEAALRPAVWTGIGSFWTPIGTINTASNTASGSGLLAFGSFSGVSSTPLPIRLLNFNASVQEERVNLTWSTASEINNSHFTVERSASGNSFEEMIRVEGKGTYSSQSTYQTCDEHPLPGISYYRLKQTDFDGKYSYSQPIAVDRRSKNTGPSSPSLYPNPAVNGKFYIRGLNASATLSIYDSAGRELFRSREHITDAREFSPDATALLPPGIYTLVLTPPWGRYTQRLVIQ